MKKSIFAILLIILVSSCGKEATREYKYVEFSRSKDILYNEWRIRKAKPEIIKAENDTVAYMKAVEKFRISQNNSEMSAGKTGKYDDTPIYFKLFDENSVDVYLNMNTETQKHRD